MVTHIRTKHIIRLALVTVLLLMIPLLAMQLSGEWDWTLSDFIFMGILIFCTGLAYELVASRGGTTLYRVAVGVAVVTAFLLVWVSAAVGIIGDDNPANLLYGGVLAIGLLGAIVSGLEPRGMATTLFTMAIAQMLVPVIALIFFPADFAPSTLGVFVINMFFALFWLASGLLFRRSGNRQKK